MEEMQKKLQKFSSVVYVFAKIGFVASIVGVCLCVAAIVWGIVLGDPLADVPVGSGSIRFTVTNGAENTAEIYGMLAYVLTSCAFLIAVMRLMMRLFANMRDHYTPFTMENAALFKRTAIVMIVAAIVPQIVGQSVGATCARLMSLPYAAEYGDNFSLVVVLMFFAMSMVFQYGCALQEQADTTL